jgi:hypothetical protein
MLPAVLILRSVAVSPCAAKSSRRKRIAFQCSSVIAMPICEASTAAKGSFHSEYWVMKPSSSM